MPCHKFNRPSTHNNLYENSYGTAYKTLNLHLRFNGHAGQKKIRNIYHSLLFWGSPLTKTL